MTANQGTLGPIHLVTTLEMVKSDLTCVIDTFCFLFYKRFFDLSKKGVGSSRKKGVGNDGI